MLIEKYENKKVRRPETPRKQNQQDNKKTVIHHVLGTIIEGERKRERERGRGGRPKHFSETDHKNQTQDNQGHTSELKAFHRLQEAKITDKIRSSPCNQRR